jgi:hypothetical protein
MLRIKDMTPRYRCEYYKDDYNSLHQAIMIDLEEEQRSDGKTTTILRSHINPNLKHHYKNIIMNKEQQIINEYNFDD